jgi:hypothetical protein
MDETKPEPKTDGWIVGIAHVSCPWCGVQVRAGEEYREHVKDCENRGKPGG